ncbi:MAG: hypothetical protein H7175_23135 [Burkholderiales bacterium]|nr:hypothetical protein [Anaerolineae bacterium]
MITQELVVGKILAHLNAELSETELVHWAEDALVTLVESDIDEPNEQMILDTLMYIGAGDTPGFPLTWSVLSAFLEKLGTKVRIVTEAS